jgi:probable HAF family extracellular repeat protein
MRKALVMPAVLFLLSAVAGDAWGQVQYTLTDLGPGDAYGINSSGQVVGENANGQAFLYSGGSMTLLGTITTYGSSAYGINNNGQVVGSAETNGGAADHAFLYSGGSMQDLGTLPGGTVSCATGINDSGQVVGYSCSNANVPCHAFLYSGGSMQDLGTLGGTTSYALGINNSGQVVGVAETSAGACHAFLYSGGAMHDLGTLGGTYSEAYGINNSGQVVGDATTSTGADHAFLYSGGVMQDLGTLGGAQSEAYGINNKGQAVGCTDYDAFLYSGGSMMAFGDFLYEPWDFGEATGINDLGQMCGDGKPYYDPNPAEDHAFLLAPTPEPSTLALLGAGAIGLLACAWRRTRRFPAYSGFGWHVARDTKGGVR